MGQYSVMHDVNDPDAFLKQCAVSDAFKDRGNLAFKEGRYADAVASYTAAVQGREDWEEDFDGSTTDEDGPDSFRLLKVNPQMKVYLSNRAFCQIRLENYGSAILDATRALEFDPSYSKANYRRGCAYMALAKFKMAQKDFLVCAKANPQDRDLRQKLAECKRQVAASAFAKAIEQEKTKPPSESLDPASMDVSQSYSGPVYHSQGDKAAFAKELMEWQKAEKLLDKRYAYQLILDALELFRQDSNVVRINVPEGHEFTVCGDIHGQYYDFCNIMQLNGMPSETNPYLFNGDFVDRGSFSVECILQLMAFKVAYPRHFFLARGNHESKNLNKFYGFEGEVNAKYEPRMYDLFCETFCHLPLAHLINEEIFVTHGGLFAKDGVTLDDIDKVNRVMEPPEEGILPELLWSDPAEANGREPSKRGVGIAFGPDVTQDFLDTNNLRLVIRSHEMKQMGFEYDHGGRILTIFSAPNYCDQMGNLGAFIKLKNSGGPLEVNPCPFQAVPHPAAPAMKYANSALMGAM